jgi:hypothetical protein
MKVCQSVLLITILCLGSVGCSPVTYRAYYYESDPEKSEALNIAHGAGLFKLDDIVLTQEEAMDRGLVGPELVQNRNVGSAGILGVTTGFQASYGVLSASDLAMGGFMIAAMLLKAEDQENRNWVFGWSDGLIEANKIDYLKGLTDITHKGIADSLIAKGLVAKEVIHHGSSNKTTKGYYLVNDTCNESEKVWELCWLAHEFYGLGAMDVNNRSFVGIIKSDIPDFKGFKDGYFWRYALADTFAKRGLAISTLDIWMEVSKRLPKEAYVYLAPGKYSVDSGYGNITYGQVPLILNQGKEMLFLKIEG